MAKLKIYTFPDKVLAQKALPIARVEKSYFKLADDMLETMYGAPGIGLAANQVGILERILVVDVDYEVDEGATEAAKAMGSQAKVLRNRSPIVIINPEIVLREGIQMYEEGCLSVPEYTAEVKRASKIKVQYQNVDGLTKEISADGLLAVALQHEMDHLEGKLFIDRLSPLKKELVRKKLKLERGERENALLGDYGLERDNAEPRPKKKK